MNRSAQIQTLSASCKSRFTSTLPTNHAGSILCGESSKLLKTKDLLREISAIISILYENSGKGGDAAVR